MTYITPPLVTEHEPGPDEDCVWASGLMLYLGAKPGAAPPTLAEAEAIRAGAGVAPTGGSSAYDLRRGLKKRYGFDVALIDNSPAALLAALAPGRAAVALGRLSYFPKGHRLRRWIPTWLGGHAIYLQCRAPGIYWWMDPEGRPPYQGENVTKAEVSTFVKTYANHAVAAIAEEPQEVVPIIDTAPARLTWQPGAQIYDLAAKPVKLTGSTVTRDSPYGTTIGGVKYRVVPVTIGGVSTLSLMRVGDPKLAIAGVPDEYAAGYAAAKSKAKSVIEAI